MIVFVDTSALYALLDEDDENHAEAKALFRELNGRADFVTTNYVEIEALALTRRRLGKVAAIRLVESILPVIRTTWVDPLLHAAGVASWRSGSGPVSIVDRISFEFMRREGIDVAFAFDTDFDAQGYRRPSVPATDRPRRVHEDAAPYDPLPSGALWSDPVSVAEIAARSGRSINTVQSWRRRHADFPVPMTQLAAAPVWDWASVASWIDARR